MDLTCNEVEKAKAAALQVLLNNMNGPFMGLPRTAAWGYPEPYTRDLMFSVLGMAASGNRYLIGSIEKTLTVLAGNQSLRGHIPSFVHDPLNRGASDTTPLFLLAVAIYRRCTGKTEFLEEAVQKALTWMEYQSPSDDYLISQQPTSDWRDEQWVLGYGLYVNVLSYAYLSMLGYPERAFQLKIAMQAFTITNGTNPQHNTGAPVPQKPYYALWAYKEYKSDRFDLLGNSLAIISGLASPDMAESMLDWIEVECLQMKAKNELAVPLPPNLFPFILPGDKDWLPRYSQYNRPGEYHNGGIWPFISALHIAALVAAGKNRLAEEKLFELTRLIKVSDNPDLEYGFNEWYKAQTAEAKGQDWQTWSASLYLYAAKCVAEERVVFFNDF